MIYSSLGLFAMLLHSHGGSAFMHTGPAVPRARARALGAVPDWTTQSPEAGEPGTVTVRFINTANGKDVVCTVEEGSNLLAVGDAHGVKLPRACRTGLCGSCTCEVKDSLAIKTETNPRDGFATIRACSTKCFAPQGEEEMVIDVYRMQNRVVSSTGALIPNPAASAFQDPMARFSGNWEKEFRPSWDMDKASAGAGQVGGASNPLNKSQTCKQCKGSGRCLCYNCKGAGRVQSSEGGQLRQCSLCVGLQTVGCGYCRGTGLTVKAKRVTIE